MPASLTDIRARFEADGISTAEWARERGFKVRTVYAVMRGESKAKRGIGHRIAVALGLKGFGARDASRKLYVGLPAIAVAAGVSRRALARPVRRIAEGEATHWRGASLVVRCVHGRGGRSGARYEVRIDSLPEEIQTKITETNHPNCVSAQ